MLPVDHRTSCGFATLLTLAAIAFSASAVSTNLAAADDRPAFNEGVVLQALDHWVTVDFQNLPARTALTTLIDLLPPEQRERLSLAFDERSLAKAEIDLDAKITLRAKSIRLESVLSFVLDQVDAGWTAENQFLVITTREAADARMLARAYDVRELAIRDDDPTQTPDFSRLIDVLQGGIAPGTWTPLAGPGSIEPYTLHGVRIVVRHNGPTHYKIARLLGELRAASLLLKLTPTERKIKKALDENTTLEFVETPLSDVVDYVKDLHGIEIQIDADALEDAGSGTDTPITRDLQGISLGSALRLTLAPLDLDFVVMNEVIFITTKEKAEKLGAKFYPVFGLPLPVHRPNAAAPSPAAAAPTAQ